MHRREVKVMTVMWVVLAIVAFAAVSALFAADSRPGPDEPQQLWFGRR